HYNVGLVYQMLGKPFESIEQFKLATRIEDNSQNQTNTGQALMASPSHDFRRAANHFPRMIDSAMFDWMKSYYQCMVRLRPGRVLLDYVGYQADAKHVGKVRYARTFSMTGTALGMDGNLKLQRYFYHRALNWHPYESEVLLRRAENARSANNLGLYAECLTSLISNTTDTELRDMIAKNNYAMALNEVGRFVNENQNNSQFWTLLAIGQMKLGDWEKAYQCAHNALVINPGNTLAQERMLEIQRQLSPAGAPAAAPQFDLEGNPLPQSLSPMPSRTAPAVNPAARRPSATGFVH
ncbi:MAG TPA: hypothetical protein PKM88_05520, partial [bacterium]|nr:hypothetical protein [bacterium]